MNKSVSVNVNQEAVLSKVSRMFNNSPESILLELAQNARRAGATKINVDFRSADKLVISHDGKPFDDFNALLSLGDSDWKAADTKSEDPAGCGFFIATLFDVVTIESKKSDTEMYQLTLTKDDLLTIGKELDIKTVPSTLFDDNVRMSLYGGHKVDVYSFDKVASHFPISMVGTHIGRDYSCIEPVDKEMVCCPYSIPRMLEDNKDKVLYDTVINGVRFRIVPEFSYKPKDAEGKYKKGANMCSSDIIGHKTYSTKYIYFNYHGHTTYDIDELTASLCRDVFTGLAGTDSNTTLVITPVGDNDIRMVLPARDNIVENDAYHTMLVDSQKALVDFINKQKEHNIIYSTYNILNNIAKIEKESFNILRNAGVTNDTLIVTNIASNPAIDRLIDECDRVYHSNILNSYEGYSWFNDINIVNADSFRICIGGWVNEQYSEEPIPDSGVVESIKFVILDDDKSTWQVLDNLSCYFYEEEGYGFYGSMLPDMRYWRTSAITPFQAINQIEDIITGMWESSSESEGDSAETQQTEFNEELKEALVDLFTPEDSVKHNILSILDKYCYALGDFDEIVFRSKAGIEYSAKADGGYWGRAVIKEKEL